MDREMKNRKVAVLGLGLTGIGALKNLLEAGFKATGFERHEHIGGLWKWSDNPNQTTVLKTTRANITKQRSCYQDFPFPDDVPDYPTGEDVADYIQSYSNHFQLHNHYHLGVKIDRLERSGDRWAISLSDKTSGQRVEYFDKVLVTTGAFHKPHMPTYEGIEGYKGKIVHAQGFKDPEDFKGQRVVVVGLSNTAGDVATDLCKVAEKAYISHRSGARILERITKKGKPLDHGMGRRVASIGQSINAMAPNLTCKLGGYLFEKKMHRDYPSMQPSWRLLPAPPITNTPPMINDHIISLFTSGTLTSLYGIKRFPTSEDSKSIEFTDGTILPSIDAVVFCTGYYFDYSILSPECNPTAFPQTEWESNPHSNGLEYPLLYQGLFSRTHPYSLAFMGPFRGHSFAAFSNADLSSQAIAQVWLGNYPLPPKSEIESWCQTNYTNALASISQWHIMKAGTPPKKLEHWLNNAAGNGVNEMLGWGHWAAWKFWWSDRDLYRLIMDGIDTPYLYRLFESTRGEAGRKKWDGARQAILEANGKGGEKMKLLA